MHDTDLLRRIQQGCSDAWRAFYASELPAIWRYAYALVGDRSVAEDILSETMLAMLRNLDKFDPDNCRIHAWLRGVAANKAVDHFRQVSRQRKILDSVRLNSAIHPNVSASASDLSKPIEIEKTRQRVLWVLDSLSETQRLSLEWKYMDRLSVREIANRLGKSEKTAEALLFRARRAFRRLYQSHERPSIILTERKKPRQDAPGGSR